MSGNTPPGNNAGPPGQDPTMEDILASIRRILNEDEAVPVGPEGAAPAAPAAAAPPGPPPAQPAEEPPLDLTEAMMVPAPEPPPAPPPPPPVVGEEGLIGSVAAAATAAALGHLARTVAAERGSPVHRGGPSIEDVVREELRPMLKEWLDAHLPGLVERLVRAEIERVVGRALS
ncbi:DUF2497 domain-containing protein [Roseomonas sp. BN140053]|uniref:DUF2497 domain-containing protein n=1 Tax=Roseomonas sp. BN140053 TaxID=3391898 RepID=UPI0039E869BA